MIQKKSTKTCNKWCKTYDPVVTLSTQGDAKLLEQLKSGFKRTINWNKYEPNVSVQAPNPYKNLLINPIFQGVNRLFALLFKNKDGRTVHTKHFTPLVDIKDYNGMIDSQNVFDQSAKNNLITYDNIQKIATDQEDDYTTGCLLDYNYFNNYYKVITIDLSKQQACNADPKSMQQINLTLSGLACESIEQKIDILSHECLKGPY